MNTREFNKELKELSNKKGILDPVKIKSASPKVKKALVEKIVRSRHAIVIDLITDDIKGWLSSMGYLYQKQGKVFNFLCTCENMKEVAQ